MTGVMVTIPMPSTAGANVLTLVCRPIQFVRFNRRARARLKTSFLYRLARLTKMVLFLPTALHREILYWLLGISVPKML